jgi:hypothetical protein
LRIALLRIRAVPRGDGRHDLPDEAPVVDDNLKEGPMSAIEELPQETQQAAHAPT